MILIRGARQLLTLRGAAPRRGSQHSELGVIHDASILIDGEIIHSVGGTRRMENLAESRKARVIDVQGKVILPGFVDSFTRPVAPPPSGPELARRFQRWPPRAGQDDRPENLAASASGPQRSATPRALRRSTLHHARMFAMHGTTGIEARSGYGTGAAQLKALRVARGLDGRPLDIATSISACLAPEQTREEADGTANRLIDHLLPAIRRRGIARVCDVDCGDGGFETEVARRILERASELGFRLKIVANGGAAWPAVELALAFDAVSVDGLGRAGLREIDRLADSRMITTLVPGPIYQGGGGEYPPARTLIDRGAAVALATGFDPGIFPTFGMAAIFSLACTQMGMTPAECISAATINGAAAIQRADRIGSLEPGKRADLAVFDVSDYREIAFSFGSNLCLLTMKAGAVIHAGPGWPVAIAGVGQRQKPQGSATPGSSSDDSG